MRERGEEEEMHLENRHINKNFYCKKYSLSERGMKKKN